MHLATSGGRGPVAQAWIERGSRMSDDGLDEGLICASGIIVSRIDAVPSRLLIPIRFA
jgi:hypothetical protein